MSFAFRPAATPAAEELAVGDTEGSGLLQCIVGMTIVGNGQKEFDTKRLIGFWMKGFSVLGFSDRFARSASGPVPETQPCAIDVDILCLRLKVFTDCIF